MEKKFEEKFGLKTEEMEEILGGVVVSLSQNVDGLEGCSACANSCIFCSSCVLCQARVADKL